MFQVDQLCFSYPHREPLFTNLTLVLSPTENWLIQGENGSGKSTLVKLLCGKLKPESQAISAPPSSAYFYLPQEAQSRILGLNLAQDLELWQMAGLDTYELKSHPLIEDFPPSYWELPLRELSQGSKQAYMLAIALQHKQRYLILDEPYPALDHRRRQILSQELANWRGLLLVSHYRPHINFDHVLDLGRAKPC